MLESNVPIAIIILTIRINSPTLFLGAGFHWGHPPGQGLRKDGFSGRGCGNAVQERTRKDFLAAQRHETLSCARLQRSDGHHR